MRMLSLILAMSLSLSLSLSLSSTAFASTCFKAVSEAGLPHQAPKSFCLDSVVALPDQQLILVTSSTDSNLFANLKTTSFVRTAKDTYQFSSRALLAQSYESCGNSETVELDVAGLVDVGSQDVNVLNFQIIHRSTSDSCHYKTRTEYFSYQVQ